jgi:hypothetical protein
MFGQVKLAAAVSIAFVLASGTAAARTISGTSRADVLTGTPRADAILGLSGNDTLSGGAGPDLLVGGPGADVLDGGPGDDRIAASYDGSRDTIRCGPGLDVVDADPLDRVAPDCELVSRRISRDPYGNPGSQHQTEVEPDSLSVGDTTVAAFQVGRRFDGGSTNIGYATSADEGRTWRSGLLPGLTTASRPPGPNELASDPVVGYDSTHGVWLVAALAVDGKTTRLTVSRSPDGVIWSTPVVVAEQVVGAQPLGEDAGIAFDKEWVACDNGPASPFRGRCYLAYTDTLRRSTLGVVSSSDGGASWSTPVEPTLVDVVGALPVIRPDGELVVPFLWQGNAIGVVTSSDGGTSFGAPTTVSDVHARTTPGFRFFPLPSADVDPSGRVWIAWHDCRSSTGCSANDVVVATSADAVRWTGPAAITHGGNAVLPAIGIQPGTGRVAVAYYTLGPAGIDAELVESRPGGVGFGQPRRLSARTMSPDWLPRTVSGRMLADYISVHYAGSSAVVVWALATPPVGASFRQAIYATRG